jgi:quercetin dioxygenase-like cupin family protein
MANYAVKRIDEMEAVFGGAFKRARAELGVESFGLQVLDFPPGATQYPEHDHAADGQEEVYTVLKGKAMLQADGEEYELEPDTFARVGPGQKRKLVTGAEPARLLALGGTPGKAYEAPEFSTPAAA